MIYADDLGYGDLGCFGSDDLDTPALDALCASGVKLPQWYSNSPVCSPSRASLMTGKYPAHAGVETILGGSRKTTGLPPQESLASQLKQRGYVTGIFGKWHLGADPAYGPLEFGFENYYGFRAGCVDYYSHIFYWGNTNPLHDLWDGSNEVWENGEYLTTLLARKAVGFIEDNADRPFFCYVPFNAPHYPLHAPKQYVDQFSHLPKDRQMMAAMIKAMDDGVGEILDALDRLGIRNDTIVFMSSDNGPSVEDRNWLNGEEVAYKGGSAGGLRGHKGSLFEGGIRVPALISWPGTFPARVVNSSVGAMMDVLPTLLNVVDGRVSPAAAGEMDGISLLPALMTNTVADDRRLFWEYEGQLSSRMGNWKIVRNAVESLGSPIVEETALYDLESDPAESVDLKAVHPDIFRSMDTYLDEWQQTTIHWRQTRP